MKPILLLAALALVVSTQPAHALPYCATSQTLTVGTIQSGAYTDLCANDGTSEVLKEGLQNGKSRLRAKWTFPSVEAGTITLHFKGTRPANSDGDNYQFYYTDTGSPFGILIPGAIIQNTFAPAEGVTITLETTTSTKDFTVFLQDTNDTGSTLDTVSLDWVTVDDGHND